MNIEAPQTICQPNQRTPYCPAGKRSVINGIAKIRIEMDSTIQILNEIEGGSAFLKRMGLDKASRFSFGDSEVVELTLNRSGSSVLKLLVSQLSSEVKKKAYLYLFLIDMIDVSIEGFLNQNVIGELEIKRAGSEDFHPSLIGYGAVTPAHHILLEPCAGAFGSIKATISKIEFLEIE